MVLGGGPFPGSGGWGALLCLPEANWSFVGASGIVLEHLRGGLKVTGGPQGIQSADPPPQPAAMHTVYQHLSGQGGW